MNRSMQQRIRLNYPRISACVFCLVSLLFLAGVARGGDPAIAPQAAELLPPTAVYYAEIPEPDKLIGTLLDHPLRGRVEELEVWKRATQTPEYFQGIIGLRIVEFALGMEWRKALETLAGAGLYAAFDPPTQGFAILARAPDEKQLLTLRDKLLTLARDDAKRNKRPDPFQTREYRGVTAYEANGSASAVVGPWLMITNKAELGKAIIDRYLDHPQGTPDAPASLAKHPKFQGAKNGSKPATLWLFADIEAARASGLAPQAYSGKADNIAAEFLFGGLLDTLKQTPYATLSFHLTPADARLNLALPHQSQWVSPAREHYFGPNSSGSATPVPETLFTFTFYRDLGKMWRRADELLTQKAAEELTQGNSGLSTLFGGKDFGEEVLGLLGPQTQLVVTRPPAEEGYPRPAVRLPAFALQFEMRNPDITRRELRRTFQSLVGFLNIIGAMNGQPQLELDVEKLTAGELVTSTYLPETGRDVEGEARINFNFSPTAAFADNRFVLSSTRT
ncbi:MAG: hypothetical protein NT069_14630, partial [Planctomycetota bacterium]|nr:hypothetical protein [Planctomycetota bacterium]